ncbi:MAG: NosL family protein [bacterium]|nr:NosL family protein [bacterium]
MKTTTFFKALLLTLIWTSVCLAQMPQTVPADQAQLLQSGPGKLYCPNCGMNLVKFYKTSHANTEHQYCSMHCFCDANPESEVVKNQARVVDFTSLKFIPAHSAFYVVGSNVKGTMTMTSKYAFADKTQAGAFQEKNGGKILSFDEAQTIARKALAKENQMIAKKRQSMAEKGRKIFETLCNGSDLPMFQTIAEAKTHLSTHQTCGTLKDGQYQAVAIFLVSQNNSTNGNKAKIVVPEKAKCPVCGMYSALYPDWTAEIISTEGTHYYFDGVKDMMKFYFEPKRYHVELKKDQMANINVSDYYSLEAMNASEAWYVLGSNVYGPMGNELIPFRSKAEAETFSQDHSGNSIVIFSEITKDLVHGLDK